jgi:IS5 family transposase
MTSLTETEELAGELVMKLKFGFMKLRYRGLKKNANQLFAVCALVNLYLVRRRLLLLAGA